MKPESILIFRIGSLGDTVVSLPALWVVREQFPQARLTMLCDHHPRKRYVLAPDLLRGTGLIDDFLLYPVDASSRGRLMRPWQMLRLMIQLRRRRFGTLIYLPPSRRPASSVERDMRFFRLAGIRNVIGRCVQEPPPATRPGAPMALRPREADLLLARLAASGIPVPPPNQGRMDLNLGAAEEQQVRAWREGLPSDGGRDWISIGPGGKQPVNWWPEDRYREVVQRLIDRFDVWPVIFAGPEDRPMAHRLLAAWGRGYSAAGELGLRATAMAMRRCLIHLGNDTGTMHLAAAAPVRCVGVYSAHDPPGEWYPYGQGHFVIRKQIDCEGCKLQECVDRKMECILRIGVDEVYAACAAQLAAAGSTARDSAAAPIAARA